MLNSQFAPKFATAVIVSLVTCISVGCSDEPPTGPTETLRVTSVSPISASAGSSTDFTVFGSGFAPGALVTVGGAATNIRVISSSSITATTPVFPAGKVDVIVTNPGGQSDRLTGAFTYLAIALTDVSPKRGLPGDYVNVLGRGFSAGTGLTIGGIAAPVLYRTGTSLTAFAPLLPPGIVDITVTNPNGERQTLAQSFTFETVVLSASPSAVAVGDPLSVTFRAPDARKASDWVGLFRFGDPNESYLWYEYTGGATQGTITIPAPNPPGDYQFRYLADDNYFDAARSGVVTVTAASGNGLATASARAIPTPASAKATARPGRGRGR